MSENIDYEALQRKKEEEINASWSVIRPKATLCRTCIHRLPDTKYTVGAEKATCDMFLDGKPGDILMQGADCDFYEKEE